jgi:competence protein ComEC
MAFASGIFLRSFFYMGVADIVFLLGVALVCGVLRRRKAFGFASPLFLTSLALVSFSLGALRLGVEESHVSLLEQYENEKIVLEGKVIREPEFREKVVHLYVEPAIEDVDEYVLVTADKFAFTDSTLGYGDLVRVSGVVKKPEPFETDGGRTFNYPGYLRARNVMYTIPFANVVVTEETPSFTASLYDGKHGFMRVIEQAIPEPESGLGEGVLLGVKRSLGDELEDTFRKTGIIHIVVLSGYNIMIVVEFIMYVLTALFFPRTRMFLGIASVCVFSLLVGFSATVVRASLMAILLIIARCTGRVYAVLRALVLALIVMLLLNPYLLVHDVGFQLSFLATLGLILFSPHIEKRLTSIPTFIGIRSFATATLATQITVLPLLLYHTGMFSVVSLVVNVLVLPMVPVAMGLTFLTGTLGTFSSVLGTVFGFLAYLSLTYIIAVARFFGSFSFSAFTIEVFPFWIVLVSYVGIALGYTTFIRHETGKKEEENPYADWIIEEEKEKPTDELRSSPSVGSFPFR